MSLRIYRAFVVGLLASVCCVLLLQSCRHSPSAPGGQLLVHVTQDGTGPAPGKQIEIVGTVFRRVTDANGLARFYLPAGSYVVRAYAIGTPGPGRPFVEQSVELDPASERQVEVNDCTRCRSPAR